MSRPCTIRIVLVPIRVHMPPRMAAYDTGRSNFDGDRQCFSVHERTAGINMATSGVLFVNADTAATGKTRRASCLRTLRGLPLPKSTG